MPKIIKVLLGSTAADLAYVSHVSLAAGGADNELADPLGMCTDGTYLYIIDYSNQRVVKRRCSDLSYVDKITTFNSVFFNMIKSIVADSTYLYVGEATFDGFGERIFTNFYYLIFHGIRQQNCRRDSRHLSTHLE